MSKMRSREDIELALMATACVSDDENNPMEVRTSFAQARAFLYWVLGGDDKTISKMVEKVDKVINERPAKDARLLRRYFNEVPHA